MLRLAPIPLLLMLSGCVVAKVAVLPVKAAGQVIETTVDATTQTRQEADEDRGKAIREEEKRAREQKGNAEDPR
jgi:uncharacterized spore protein YtfJ